MTVSNIWYFILTLDCACTNVNVVDTLYIWIIFISDHLPIAKVLRQPNSEYSVIVYGNQIHSECQYWIVLCCKCTKILIMLLCTLTLYGDDIKNDENKV
jgi:hypothetical protein